jgi:hypothetical protein
VVLVAVPGARATQQQSTSLALALHLGEITPQELESRIPRQVGAYKLTRTWQQKIGGAPVLEAASYESTSSGEIEIGVWLPSSDHSIQASMLTRGEIPKTTTPMIFATENGSAVSFNTALYDDGVNDTFIGDTYCTPISCQIREENEQGFHLALQKVVDHRTVGKRAVPIFFKLQVTRTDAPPGALYKQMSEAPRDFLAHLDLTQLSRQFQ